MQPDTAIYNSIMRQQAAAGLGPGALQDTLADMEAHGLMPDRRSLFALLRAFSREGDLAGAMHVMHRMAQLGVPSATGIEVVKGHIFLTIPFKICPLTILDQDIGCKEAHSIVVSQAQCV